MNIDFAGIIAQLQKIEKMSQTPNLKNGQKLILYEALARIGKNLEFNASGGASKIVSETLSAILKTEKK